jgi:hypothetical protein
VIPLWGWGVSLACLTPSAGYRYCHGCPSCTDSHGDSVSPLNSICVTLRRWATTPGVMGSCAPEWFGLFFENSTVCLLCFRDWSGIYAWSAPWGMDASGSRRAIQDPARACRSRRVQSCQRSLRAPMPWGQGELPVSRALAPGLCVPGWGGCMTRHGGRLRAPVPEGVERARDA